MEQIYVRQKIEVGLENADEGRHIPHEQAFEEFDDDTDPLD